MRNCAGFSLTLTCFCLFSLLVLLQFLEITQHSVCMPLRATRRKRKIVKTSGPLLSIAGPGAPFEHKVNEIFRKNGVNVSSMSYNLEKAIVKDLRQAVNLSNLQPNEDFYSYINDRWLKNIDLEANKKYIIQVDNFRLTQDLVYRELIELIRKWLRDPANRATKKGKSVKAAFSSFSKFTANSKTVRETADVVQQICAIADTDPWKLLAFFNNNEIISWGAPFVWSVNPDDKHPDTYICCIEPPALTLLDTGLYAIRGYRDDVYSKKTLHNYRRYLQALFKIAFGTAEHGYDVWDVYIVECELSQAMSCVLSGSGPGFTTGEKQETYNLVSALEAMKHFGFDWATFSKELGIGGGAGGAGGGVEFVTSNINYMICGTKLLLKNWNTPRWKTYWIYLYIRQMCRWDEYGWQNFYEFQGNFVRGQEAAVDPAVRPVFGMGFTWNSLLTNLYVDSRLNPEAIQYVKNIAEDLRLVFIRIVQRNAWMSPETKRVAIHKLEKIQVQVGSPKKLRKDPILPYCSDNPWFNLKCMAEWRHRAAIKLIGRPIIDIPVIDWSEIPPKFISTQAYVVNAMYTPSDNSIYIPLGYVQKPFVDLGERGIEYNLAHVGYTIAHEMSHALDDWGSQYDAEGRLFDWWTPRDKSRFAAIQRNIVDQYETLARRDGYRDFDAWPSVGEDIADISGLDICLEYLRDFQLKNEDILPIQSKSFEVFFIYFALQSRQKIGKRAIAAQLRTNPHPLDKYRCNVPLSRSRVFRAIYNVKRGDGMWWSSLNSVWDQEAV